MTNYGRLFRHAVFCAILFGLSSLPAQAQFWEKKDWREWSKDECQKLLTNSPWARRFSAKQVPATPPPQPRRSGESVAAAGDTEQKQEEIEYVVQLRSALPVRQAVVRVAQIQNNYDKLSPEQKKEFDEQSEPYLTHDFGNRVVFHVYYAANQQTYEQQLARMWQSVAPPKMPANTSLIASGGDAIEPTNFIKGEGGAQEFELVFSKERGGKPVVTPEDKKFTLQLPPAGFYRSPVKIDFDPRKMKYRGNLEY